MIFVAGQGARDSHTDKLVGVELNQKGEVVAHDIQVQTRQILSNIENALAQAGATKHDLVDILVFLKDMRDFPGMNKVWNEYFTKENCPTRTTVAVTDLPPNNFIEMKATAYKPN
jgi:2-aminomuconate deaminase